MIELFKIAVFIPVIWKFIMNILNSTFYWGLYHGENIFQH